MLTLTNPSALLALLGLLVPLAIHLWNRRPGREVAVGSLRWLAAGANRRLRNLRLEQVLVLLLRAALLAVLALAIAGPAWRQAQPASRGQVLVSPALVGTGSLAAVRSTIDSLRRQGYGLRWLAAGFPAVAPADWRADSAGKSTYNAAAAATTTWYWSRVQQASATFAGQPLYVLTPATLAGFGGTHPALTGPLTWQALPTRHPETWLHSATAAADSLHLLVGRSDEATLTFQRVSVKQPTPGTTLQVNNLAPLGYNATGMPSLQPLPANGQPAVPVLPVALRVWVVAPGGTAADARYLRAALRAAAVGLPARLDLTVAPTPPDTTTRPDWLFWLSEAPVPAVWRAQVRRGLHLWQQATGPGRADTTTLVAPEAAAPLGIWQRASQPRAGGQPLWTDSRGRAVLTQQRLGAGATYYLATRLHPAWSALPASPALPALLLSLLAPTPTAASLAPHDQRRFDAAQLPAPPVRAAVISGRAPGGFRLLDLRPWLVLAAGLLFALERWLAQRRAALPPSLA
ncbi:hypothetical protein GO988_09305 [Hymenobacter sp. HMF4947]|uniref:Aerotolerance regulator N-terminal domain-containing protein n=1 Tax=Hymenobacter ginkgonis TaxID=2682976 RepID=A0A7K1TDN7_9BACT|nr:BatA domain-containing protein [Hymenobacter ginkgonis]MVN76519.1 hypothetical protein [Hymenobacter ginkgonis]